MEKLNLSNDIIGDLSDLSFLPKNPLGYIVLIEVRGGVDKGINEKIRLERKGHRPDTIPICNELINEIPNNKLNQMFIEKMKNRNLENALSKRYYKEFNQISLALKLNKRDREVMIQNLKSLINS